MTDAEQRNAAKEFAEAWSGKGYEKGDSQKFWLSLLRNVFGVEKPEDFIFFEEQVKLDHTSFIDGSIPTTHVLIEQKGLGKDLKKPIKQSDGTLLQKCLPISVFISHIDKNLCPLRVSSLSSSFSIMLLSNGLSGPPCGIPISVLSNTPLLTSCHSLLLQVSYSASTC